MLAALFVVCWSSGFIGAKLGAADAAVPTVLMWRFVPLALLLTPFLRRGSTSYREFGRHVLIGLLSQAGYLLTVYWAIGEGVSTGTTALIDGVQPLVAAALAGPLLGATATGRQWGGLALGLAGVAMVSWSDAGSQAPAWAYLIPFGGMLGLVASTVLERRASIPVPPLRALAIHCLTSAVVFTILAVATGTAAPPASGRFWLALAWLIVLATFGGYGLYWLLVDRIGVTAVNSLMFLIAPVTSVWGAALFDEPFTVLTGAGLALALIAAVVANRRVGGAVGSPRSSPPCADASSCSGMR
ncbi:DMT family transporter [Amycolatopsis jejuensis]|uniref:DMT family transporter n=1 Tax=Amycolatopsis jejuensis TaxID=330084 RepID=UPI000A99EC2E|nr:DMT family transporter [Amycolatopsis jejuensis]